eukprot:EG_transcript_6699
MSEATTNNSFKQSLFGYNAISSIWLQLAGVAATFFAFGALMAAVTQRKEIAVFSASGQAAEPEGAEPLKRPFPSPAAKPKPLFSTPANSFSNIFQAPPSLRTDSTYGRGPRSTSFTDISNWPSNNALRNPQSVIDIGGGVDFLGDRSPGNPFTRLRGSPSSTLSNLGMGLGLGLGKGKGFGKGFGKGRGFPVEEEVEEEQEVLSWADRRRALADPDAPPMNEDIKYPQLRLVRAVPGGRDEKLGVMSRQEALELAEAEDIDLVLVSIDTDPPVAKLVNYSKLKYESEKKKKDSHKKGKVKEVKELKVSHKIGQHDYDVRVKQARKFLEGGHRIKVSMEFKGRENQFVEIGRAVMKRFQNDLADMGKADAVPKKLGTRLILNLAPAGEALKVIAERRAERDRKAAAEEEEEGDDLDFVDENEDEDVEGEGEEEEAEELEEETAEGTEVPTRS